MIVSQGYFTKQSIGKKQPEVVVCPRVYATCIKYFGVILAQPNFRRNRGESCKLTRMWLLFNKLQVFVFSAEKYFETINNTMQ